MWSQAKKKSRKPLVHNGLRDLSNHSHSIVYVLRAARTRWHPRSGTALRAGPRPPEASPSPRRRAAPSAWARRRRRGLQQQAVVVHAAHHLAPAVEDIFAHHRPGGDLLQTGELLQHKVQICLARCHCSFTPFRRQFSSSAGKNQGQTHKKMPLQALTRTISCAKVRSEKMVPNGDLEWMIE